MPFNADHITQLWKLYISNQASKDQVKELFDYLREPGMEARNTELLSELMSKSNHQVNHREDLTEPWATILNTSPSLQKAWQEQHQAPVKTLSVKRFIKYAAAIIILIGLTITAIILSKEKNQPQLTQQQQPITPGTQKAILTLSDGTVITLDSAKNGTIAQQGNATIQKANGQITYNNKGEISSAVMMNTMSTPNGGQYQLMLPDGSQAWLNAASSITFPAAFTGKDRTVKVTGEVYFEIKKNKEKPFIVDVNNLTRVEVLGTHFNVNSYTDAEAIKVTLLEGAVKVKANTSAQVLSLKPGQQAVYKGTASPLTLNRSADIEQVMAWKNGQFVFGGASIQSVMKEISRWYNVDVQYEGPVPVLNLGGTISRQENIKEVLNMLELTQAVKFKIAGRKIIVTAGN